MQPQLKYTAIVKHLIRCPPELVHEIIGDLSIAKILDILTTHNNAYLDQCVSSHLVLASILPPQVLVEVKEYFFIYSRLAALTKHKRRMDPEPNMQLLSFDGVQFRSRNRDILQILKDAVLKRMEVYYPYLPVLQHYATKPIPDGPSWKSLSSAAELGEVYRTLDATEMVINNKKAEQLGRMARIVEENPRMLRSRSDWGQELRKNSQHIASNLTTWKKKMQRLQIVPTRIVATSIFAGSDLFLIPYNRFLRAFLKVLWTYPPSQMSSRSKGLLQTSERATHDYPAEMGFVLEGLEFIFPRDMELEEKQPQARTEYTPFSTGKKKTPRGYNQPIFDSFDLGKGSRDVVSGFIPAADKELDWLESFLRMCKYMASMQVEMKQGQTVAEFWAIHT